jgi:hypothetical protein
MEWLERPTFALKRFLGESEVVYVSQEKIFMSVLLDQH